MIFTIATNDNNKNNNKHKKNTVLTDNYLHLDNLGLIKTCFFIYIFLLF